METLVKSDVFDHEGNTFLIDVVRLDSGKEVIRLKKTIPTGPRAGSRILQFDQLVLDRINQLLKAKPEEVVFSTTTRITDNPRLKRLTVEDRAYIVKTYLKNVTAADIAIKYNCKPMDIEQVLREEGIAVVDSKPPRRFWRKRY